MRFLRSGLIEVLDIGTQDTMQLLLMQDDQVIDTLATHTAQKAFTDRISPWCVIRRFQDLDAAGLDNPIEGHPILAIVSTDEILRSHAIGSGLPKLLGGPSVGGISCDAHVDHSPRVEFDNEEGKQRAEEEVSHWEKVTGPDLLSMGVQEGLPGLSMWSCSAYSSHVLLNGALADADAYLEQFASDPLCSPQSVVPCHLLNQGHRFRGNPGCERSCPRLVLPIEFEALAMPPKQRLWLDNEQRLLPGLNHSCQ